MSGTTREPPDHVDADELVTLALGHVDGRRRAALAMHVRGCETCRAEYEELALTIAEGLAAVPAVQPPVGFDAAVIARLTAVRSGVGRARRTAGRRLLAWVAAVVLVVAAAGAVLAAVAVRGDDAAAVAPLRRVDGGEAVGSVTRSEWAGAPVLIVAVLEAPEDVSYTCRMRLRDGTVVDSRPWPAVERGAWIVELPAGAGGVDAIERVELLVTGTERIWSTATL